MPEGDPVLRVTRKVYNPVGILLEHVLLTDCSGSYTYRATLYANRGAPPFGGQMRPTFYPNGPHIKGATDAMLRSIAFTPIGDHGRLVRSSKGGGNSGLLQQQSRMYVQKVG